MNWNITDAVILLLLLICMLNGYKRGLILELFRLCSGVLSLLLGWKLYPVVAKIMRETDAIYGSLKSSLSSALNLDGMMQEQTLEAQTKLIDSLRLPDFLTRGLLDNNNPVLYNALNVDKINDYIISYLANICINVIAFFVVVIVVSIVMSILSSVLHIVSKIPIIGGLNRLGGLAVGIFEGTLAIWLVMLIPLLFAPAAKDILDMVQNSVVASFFYQHNMLLQFISNIAL